jgi:hypothetical protein
LLPSIYDCFTEQERLKYVRVDFKVPLEDSGEFSRT